MTWQKNIPANGRYSVDDARFFLGMSIGEFILSVNDKRIHAVNLDYADLKAALGKSEYVFISSANSKDCSVAVKEAVDRVYENIDSYARILALVITTEGCLMSSFEELYSLNGPDVAIGIVLDKTINESYAILVCAEIEREKQKKGRRLK